MKNKASLIFKISIVALAFYLVSCKKGTTDNNQTQSLGFIQATDQQLGFFQAAPTLSLNNLPKVVTLPMPPIGNQKQQGSCTSWATAYAVNSYFKHLREFTNYQYDKCLLSPSYVYNQIVNGTCTGTSYPENFNVMIKKGCCSLEDLSYDDQTCFVRNTPDIDQKASLNKLLKFELVNKTDITNLKALLYSGFPIMIAVEVDASFDNLQSPYIWKQKSGSVRGGHAIVVMGYDDTKNAFKVQNSWGENWKDNGFLWIDYDFFPTAVIGNECYIAYPQSGNTPTDQIVISLSGDMNFGTVAIGQTVSKNLKISCSGNNALIVNNIVLPGGFSGSFSGVIQPNYSRDINITFSPSQAINYQGIITVNANQTTGTNTVAIVGTGSGQSPVDDLTKGLIVYLPFTGNANDESGNGHNGLVNGASLVTDRNGNTNSAYSFDGVSSYVTGQIPNVTELSISVWFKCDNADNKRYQTVISLGQESVMIQIHNSYDLVDGISYKGAIWTGLSNNNGIYKVNSNSADNVWHHIVFIVSYLDLSQKVYLDGTLYGTQNISKAFNSFNYYDIGRSNSPCCGYFKETMFKGLIDEVRIYNRSLSNNEVLQLYQVKK
jgi:hypothetical protein